MFMVTPPLFMLVGVAVSYLIRRQAVALVLLTVTFLSVTVVNNIEESNPARDDFRAAPAFVGRDFQSGETVFVFPGYDVVPLDYYFPHDEAVLGLDPSPGSHPTLLAAIDDIRAVAEIDLKGSFWIVIRDVDEDVVGYEVSSELPDILDATMRSPERPGSGAWRPATTGPRTDGGPREHASRPHGARLAGAWVTRRLPSATVRSPVRRGEQSRARRLPHRPPSGLVLFARSTFMIPPRTRREALRVRP